MTPLPATVLSALLLWAAFPPLDLGFVALVAPAPFLWAVRRAESGGRALGLGFVFGLAFFGPLLWFIFILGAVAWIPLVVWMSTTTAVLALWIWRFCHWSSWRWLLMTLAGWASIEWLRGLFPFGGFPWGSVGTAAGGVTGAIGSVQWIGPRGWTVVAIAISAGVVLFHEDRTNWRLLVDPTATAMILILAGSLLGPSAEGELVRVAIVQGNSPCPQVHCQSENQLIYASHLELTQGLDEGSVDLIVWPENSLGTPYEPEGNQEVDDTLSSEAVRLSAYFVASGTRSVGDSQFLNVNTVYAPNGDKLGEYRKRHPVPFGEYVPLRGALNFISQLSRVPRDMIRGEGPVVFDTPRGNLGTVISYEGAFGRIMRSQAQKGSQLMVVATNESSFTAEAASDQLIGLVRVNAAAIGQDVVHAAITGKSTFISAGGDVGETTESFETTVLEGRVRFQNAGPTLYTRIGDWVLLTALVGAVVAWLMPGNDRTDPLSSRRRSAQHQ